MKKTITLCGQYDEPEFSILEGHVDLKTFNDAFVAEGWTVELWPDDYVSHEYWRNLGDGKWECSNKTDSLAIPVTVAAWDGPVEQPVANGPNPSLH